MKKIFIIILLLTGYIYPVDKNKKVDKSFTYIGKITKNENNSFYPSRYFVLDDSTLYEGFTHRAGGVNLYFKSKPPEYLEKSILLKGELKRDLTTVLKKIKKIKESEFMGKEFNKMKVKSAWLPPENFESDNSLISTIPGVTNLKRLSSLAYFEVSEYSWPDLVSISEHSKKQIKVTINNSSGIQLPSLNLIVKYEGRKGTPAPKFNHINIPSLKNGESKEIILDKVYIVQYTKVSSEDFSIYSVELTGQGSKVLVNLQVPVKNKFE